MSAVNTHCYKCGNALVNVDEAHQLFCEHCMEFRSRDMEEPRDGERRKLADGSLWLYVATGRIGKHWTCVQAPIDRRSGEFRSEPVLWEEFAQYAQRVKFLEENRKAKMGGW